MRAGGIRTVAIALGLVATAGMGQAQTTAQIVDALRAEGQSVASRGQLDEALAIYGKAVELAPHDVALRLEYGELLKARGKLLEAIGEFDRVLTLRADDEKAAVARADAYRRIPNYTEARRLLDAWVAAHPRSAAALVALGDLQIELQHYDEAIGYLRRALELEPENLTARVNLGVAHRARNEWAAALKEFDLAISRNPKLAEAYYFRGTTYADQNLNDQALADARSVLALVPDSVPGRLLLASASVRLGRCPEAVSALEPLRATRPGDTELLLLLGRAYQCAGNSTRAQETTLEFAEMSKREQSERERRTQSRNLVIKGNELARSNRPIEALEALREAIEKDSGNDAAYAQLAKIYASAGRLDQARAAIDQALSTNPHNPDYRYVLGRVLAQQGQLADALTAFEQATRGNPKDADAFFQMGTIHARLADRERAEAAFKKAIELSPEDREYQAALANLRREPKE